MPPCAVQDRLHPSQQKQKVVSRQRPYLLLVAISDLLVQIKRIRFSLPSNCVVFSGVPLQSSTSRPPRSCQTADAARHVPALPSFNAIVLLQAAFFIQDLDKSSHISDYRLIAAGLFVQVFCLAATMATITSLTNTSYDSAA